MAVGVLGALAVAASAAGWWAPAGIVLAAALAFLARQAVAEPETRQAWLVGGLRSAARLATVVFAAATFAVYLVPGHRAVAAVAFVAVVALAELAGVRLDDYWRRWVGGLLVVAALAFVALCLGIAPVVEHDPVAVPPVPGVLLAAAVFVPWFAGLSGRRLATAAGLALVVTGAALYQLGALRLGLSPTSLRDVFSAADARAVEPALGAVVVLATVPAAIVAFTGARADLPTRGRVSGTVVPAAVAALLAAVLGPPGAALVAAAMVLAEIVAAVLVPRSRQARDVAAAALAVVLLGGLVAGLWVSGQ